MKNNTASTIGSRRMLLIFGGIITVFIAGFFFTQYSEKRADMYLMPDGFKGTATVFFNDPDGMPEKWDGKRRVFEIPTSGTLYTQSAYKKKWNNYYYVQPGGRLRQLRCGDARTGGLPISYADIDSIWIDETDAVQRDTDSKKLMVAAFTVKEIP
ncbi:MAG: hypothetical protein J0H46_14495 [Bacteroidetes bacterium]|nr:hypothetical protein [Bacteroidota bacterium]